MYTCTHLTHHMYNILLKKSSILFKLDDPEKDEHIDGDPFNTLFVTHLSPELTESDLAREFELYGQIKKIRLIHDKEGKSRCYAFIEYEREKDMRGKKKKKFEYIVY